jgi:hypothetical protein
MTSDIPFSNHLFSKYINILLPLENSSITTPFGTNINLAPFSMASKENIKSFRSEKLHA